MLRKCYFKKIGDMEVILQQKADADALALVNEKLEEKADADAIALALAEKASADAVALALSTKADKDVIDLQIASKVSTTTYNARVEDENLYIRTLRQHIYVSTDGHNNGPEISYIPFGGT